MNLPDAIDRIRTSTMIIDVDHSPTPETRKTESLGTGFLVSVEPKAWIITALHVVEAARKVIASTIEPRFLAGYSGPNIVTSELLLRAPFLWGEVDVIATDADNDLALLRMRGDLAEQVQNVGWGPGDVRMPKPRPASLQLDRPRDGTPTAVSGYALGEPHLVTTSGPIASAWAWEWVDHGSGQGEDRYIADLTANPGNSGGPAFLPSNANIIGVCVAGKLTPIVGGAGLQMASLTIVIPATAVEKLCANHGVSCVIAGTTAPGQGKKKRRR